MFWAPQPRNTIFPITGLSILCGIAIVPSLDLFLSVSVTVVVFAVPALLAAVLTKPLAEAFGGRMYLRRSALMALFSLAIILGVVLVADLLLYLYSVATNTAIDAVSTPRIALFSFSAVLWFRHVVLVGISQSNHMRTLPASSLHSLLAYPGIFIIFPPEPADLLLSVLFPIVFLLSAIAFTYVAGSPLRKGFGIDGLKMMRYFLDHLTERGTEGTSEIEQFLEAISIPMEVTVGVMAFRSKHGLKALLVAPWVHPGPMGHVGGSDLPAKLHSLLSDLTPNVVVAHGPSTHDRNPVSSLECEKLASEIRDIVAHSRYDRSVSKFVHVSSGRATVCAQIFDKSSLMISSLAPNPTDDIDPATAHAAVQAAKLAGLQDAVFIDAHNCLQEGVGLTHFGTQDSRDIIEASSVAAKQALTSRTRGLKVGFAMRGPFCPEDDGLGRRGIQVLVVEVAGQSSAYILFDGNNMVPGLREEILASVHSLVDEAEVMTSDNHSVNVTMDSFNPIGMKLDRAKLMKTTEEVVKEAIDDLEEVEVAVGTGVVSGLKVFGPETSARLSTAVNSTVAVLRPTFVLCIVSATLASLLAWAIVG